MQATEHRGVRAARCPLPVPRMPSPWRAARVSRLAGRLYYMPYRGRYRASRVKSSKQGTFAWLERLRSLAPRPRLLFPRSLAAVLKPAERCRVSVTTALLALIIHPVCWSDGSTGRESLTSSPRGFASIPAPGLPYPLRALSSPTKLDRRSYLYPRPGLLWPRHAPSYIPTGSCLSESQDSSVVMVMDQWIREHGSAPLGQAGAAVQVSTELQRAP